MITVRTRKAVTGRNSSEHVSSFWDFLPTFCEIAGVPAPADADGISFLNALTGREEEQQDHEYLYWEFYEKGGKQAIRKGNWKAVRLNVISEDSPVTEPYDLSKDLSEENDISGNYPGIVAEMEHLMKEAHKPFPGSKLYPSEN